MGSPGSGSQEVSASPSRVVENIGTFRDRKAFWDEKDVEEKKKRESVSSVEDYTQGIENTAFIGEENIDEQGQSLHFAVVDSPAAAALIKRTPSPYEIERSKEAIFLDTDEPGEELIQHQIMEANLSEKTDESSPDRKVVFRERIGSDKQQSFDPATQADKRISREIFEAELAEGVEALDPESKSILSSKDSVDKSEIETSEKHPSPSESSLREVRRTASSLITEIESTVERQLGIEPKMSEPSSMDITDEELLSTGGMSSPETQRSTRGQDMPEGASGVEGSATGTGDTNAVRSSSSGEFFTAPEDSTLKSSSDGPSRPMSWDSSVLGQVSNNFPTSGSGNSEYETAQSRASGVSSTESYLGSLSSDASESGTLVASQISLGRELLLDDEEESAGSPPPLPPRGHTLPQPPQQQVTSRSVHCEAGQEDEQEGSGYPITLTSSTSGTTVCTQVETSRTFEAKVKGEPEREDNQEGNIMLLELSGSPRDQSTEPSARKTHRRSESQSWSDSLLYGIEERIEDEHIRDIVMEEEISDLFLGDSVDDSQDPIERPITPEPFSPEERQRNYYPGSSFDQLKDSFQDDEDNGPTDYEQDRDSMFDRGMPTHRLEDIEEEGSLKNSPKSVLSLEMSSSLPELEEKNGNGNGEKSARPGSRGSSSSLKEFESLEEMAVLEDEKSKIELSEIEEGHESQVSEESDETEMIGEQDDDPSFSVELDHDEKIMKIFSERIQSEDSENSSSLADARMDPMAFFTTTVTEPRSPETDNSQFEDFHQRSSEGLGTTDADSSLEYRVPEKQVKMGERAETKMSSSGDSLDEPICSAANLMQVSRDSLDLDKDDGNLAQAMTVSSDSLQGQVGSRPGEMTDSLIRSGEDQIGMADSLIRSGEGLIVMTDSLELPAGQSLPHVMSDSADSLTGRSGDERSSMIGAAGVMGTSTTSTDSLEGPGVADPNLSSTSSTAADAGMWSSTGGSISTLVSSQEDLTLENQS